MVRRLPSSVKVREVKCVFPGDPANMCPLLFKGSRSLLLLACCYVTYRQSCAYLYRRYLFVWQPCCNSRMGTALFVHLSVCGSIYVYHCQALLVTGCTCIYAYNLAWGGLKNGKNGGEPNGFCLVFVVRRIMFEIFMVV